MENEKRGQAKIIAAILFMLGSLVFVSAALTNSTDDSVIISFNDSLNITLVAEITRETVNEVPVTDNLTVENQTTDDSALINEPAEDLTLPNESTATNEIENLSVPTDDLLSINQTDLTLPLENTTPINDSLPKKQVKDLTKIVEKNKNKFNDKTINYLKNNKNKKEEKEFIIKFRNSIDEDKLTNVTLDRKINRFKLTKIKGKIEDIQDLIEDDEIEFLELEQDVDILGENISFNIKKVKADSVWNTSKGSGVKVAVLDTGISLHDDLSLTGGVSFVDDSYYDTHGHGTKVAGVVAALLDDDGLVGVAPGVSLYSVKIMQSSTGDLSNAISGIEWAIDNNMDIVSMSFGIESYSQIFKEVLQEAYDNGILLVAASGNEGDGNILYPARYSSVIAVGALTANDNLASFSSYGFEQELMAPGVDINTTTLGNTYSLASGTSMSTPHVTGAAALIKAFNNSLTNIEIRNKLKNDALDLGEEGKDDLFGYGLVQVNLDVFNFTEINESYFYEVFNITNFRLLNETYLFWLSGEGTIDDVDFMAGYYLVNITYNNASKRSDIYNVSENGSIYVLALGLDHQDNYTSFPSTDDDGILWTVGKYEIKLTGSIPEATEAECYEYTDPTTTIEECFFEDTEDDCDFDFNEIKCSSGTTCNEFETMGAFHQILDTSTKSSYTVTNQFYNNCDGAGGGDRDSASGSKSVYVIDMKRARCLNSSDYVIEGRYGTNSWVQIGAADDCGSNVCSLALNTTNPSANLNPCLPANTCTGTVQVITEDSDGNPIQNLLVNRDEASNITTDDFGVASFDLTKTCGQNLEFIAYCLNNVTICGTHTTALDKIDDFEGKLFDCSVCKDIIDFQLNVEDVSANKENNQVEVNISLFNVPVTSSVIVNFKIQGNDGLISREKNYTFSTTSGQRFESFTQSITLNGNDDFVHVYVDFTDKVQENNEKNNYALIPLFEKQIDVYFDVDVGHTKVNNKIKEYIKLFVNEEAVQNSADVTLCVGRKCSNFDSLNSYTLGNWQKKQKFGYDNYKLIFDGKDVGKGKPYNAIVGGFWKGTDGKKYIMVYGNDIDGDIAAVKKLISARDLFLNKDLLFEDRTKVIDDFDTTGIAVIDLLQNPSNFPYYTDRGSDRFATVVERILTNNNFEIAIRTVQTLNETSYSQKNTLRLKNVNSDFSQNYKEVITSGTKPVVMSGGIFSNLVTWEDNGKGLARDLINDGHDVWEIEMSGGDNIECDTCSDYTYEDQVDYFWPVLIAGVMNYSGNNQVNYVGHSNGCRAALNSLNSYSSGKIGSGWAFNTVTGLYDINISLPNLPVDKFFGVACPATLNDLTGTSELARELEGGVAKGDKAINEIRANNLLHIKRKEYSKRLSILGWFDILNNNKISTNLMDFYNDISIETNTQFSLQSNIANEFNLFAGTKGYLTLNHYGGDGVVPLSDMQNLSNSLDNSNLYLINKNHGDLITDYNLKLKVREELK